MKYSPRYFRPLGVGDVGFTCIRQDDYVMGIEWWIEDDAKVYSVFTGFAHIQAEDVRAVRQARKSIDAQETRHEGLGRLLWLKQQLYGLIQQLKELPHGAEYWSLTIHGADTQRSKVYTRLCRDPHWKVVDGDLYYIE